MRCGKCLWSCSSRCRLLPFTSRLVSNARNGPSHQWVADAKNTITDLEIDLKLLRQLRILLWACECYEVRRNRSWLGERPLRSSRAWNLLCLSPGVTFKMLCMVWPHGALENCESCLSPRNSCMAETMAHNAELFISRPPRSSLQRDRSTPKMLPLRKSDSSGRRTEPKAFHFLRCCWHGDLGSKCPNALTKHCNLEETMPKK